MVKKRSDDRQALADTILLRDDAEFAHRQHAKAREKATALVREAENAVSEAEVNVDALSNVAREQLVGSLYDAWEPIGNSQDLGVAREGLLAAETRLGERKAARDAVQARVDEAAEMLARLNRDVDSAARKIVTTLGDAAVDAAIEAHRAAMLADMRVKAISSLSTPSWGGEQGRAERYARCIVYPEWPGTLSHSETEQRNKQTLAAWSAIFEDLKRDPDVKLPV